MSLKSYQSSNNSSTSGGASFLSMLTILFIALKLLKKIDWSWWWVLSPVWIPIALLILVTVSFFAFGMTKDWLMLRKLRKKVMYDATHQTKECDSERR